VDTHQITEWISSLSPHTLPLGIFLICFVSGFFPIVNAEITVLAAGSVITKTSDILLLGLMAGIGQVLSKSGLYWLASKAPDAKFIHKRVSKRKMDLWHKRVMHWGWKLPLFLFASAFFGIPPFLIISVLMGFLKTPFKSFFIIAFLGRTLRFSLLLCAPKYFMEWLK
jgi:membrane protein YqaA with SNARE-associated domain